MLGTSDAWWMSHSSERPSVLCWRLSDIWSKLAGKSGLKLNCRTWIFYRLHSTVLVSSQKEMLQFQKGALYWNNNVTNLPPGCKMVSSLIKSLYNNPITNRFLPGSDLIMFLMGLNFDVPNSFVTSKNNIFCKVELKMAVYSPSVTASDISQDSKVSFEGFSKGGRATGIGGPREALCSFWPAISFQWQSVGSGFALNFTSTLFSPDHFSKTGLKLKQDFRKWLHHIIHEPLLWFMYYILD